MCGLDHSETVGCPVVGEGAITVEGGEVVGGALAVGEEDHRQGRGGVGGCWEGEAEREIDGAGWGGEGDGGEGYDWGGGW